LRSLAWDASHLASCAITMAHPLRIWARGESHGPNGSSPTLPLVEARSWVPVSTGPGSVAGSEPGWLDGLPSNHHVPRTRQCAFELHQAAPLTEMQQQDDLQWGADGDSAPRRQQQLGCAAARASRQGHGRRRHGVSPSIVRELAQRRKAGEGPVMINSMQQVWDARTSR
jgi:hypothetical protein